MLLALDTSSKQGSVAVFDEKNLLHIQIVGGSGKSASQLTPTIMSVIEEVGIEIGKIGCVAVATGPGSFTGLRVGVTTAKVLAYALNCDVLGVNTLTAIAANAFQATIEQPSDSSSDHAELVATVDAQRQQLFVLRCVAGDTWSPQSVGEVEIIERGELAKFAGDAAVLGPGLQRLSPSDLDGVTCLSPSLWECSAEAVGRHAMAVLAGKSGKGQAVQADFWSLKPNYFRASSAEEKLLAKTVRP